MRQGDTAQHPVKQTLTMSTVVPGENGDDQVAIGDYQQLLTTIPKFRDDVVPRNTVGITRPPLEAVNADTAVALN
jgi:hypothetical protein